MNKAIHEMKGMILAEKMKNLRVGQDDLVDIKDIKFEI